MSVALAIVALAACGGGGPDATPTPSGTHVAGSPTAAVPTVTTQPTPSPSPTPPPEVGALLAPGPTFPLPNRAFFLNGLDLWQYPAGGTATKVTNNLRLGPYAQSADGERVAVVVYAPAGQTGSEEIRVYGADGGLLGSVYGPTPTSGAGAGRAIIDLAWSWDGAALAVAFNDGTIEAVAAPGGAAGPDPVTNELVGDAAADHAISAVEWAPSGAGIAYLLALRDGGESLLAAPLGHDPLPALDASARPARSALAYSWLPGRGRIAYVEDANGTRGTPGSIFTIAPDGSARELLVSSGGFAPVAGAVALAASQDGQKLAFTIYMPDARGEFSYQSLWVLNIDSGDLAQVPVNSSYRVTDLWWISSGLVLRGVDRGSSLTGDQTTYDRSSPFVLGLFDPASGQTSIVFQSVAGH
jgi:hypothetical protein